MKRDDAQSSPGGDPPSCGRWGSRLDRRAAARASRGFWHARIALEFARGELAEKTMRELTAPDATFPIQVQPLDLVAAQEAARLARQLQPAEWAALGRLQAIVERAWWHGGGDGGFWPLAWRGDIAGRLRRMGVEL